MTATEDRCPTCDGNGWVDDATGDGYHFVRPCGLCRPELYDRWRAGHLEPGHACDECRQGPPPKRRGPRSTANEPPSVPPPTSEQMGVF